jgi:hypothetical protein
VLEKREGIGSLVDFVDTVLKVGEALAGREDGGRPPSRSFG